MNNLTKAFKMWTYIFTQPTMYNRSRFFRLLNGPYPTYQEDFSAPRRVKSVSISELYVITGGTYVITGGTEYLDF